MSTRSLIWGFYGLVTSVTAVWLSMSHLRASGFAWVLYSMGAAGTAMILSWAFARQRRER